MKNSFIPKFYQTVSRCPEQEIVFMNKKGEYQTYSYQDIWNRSLKYAQFLVENNIKPGDVVSIMLQTSIEYLSLFIACQQVRAIPVSLYPPSSFTDLDGWEKNTIRMIKSVDAKVVITENKILKFIDFSSACSSIDIDKFEKFNESVFKVDTLFKNFSEEDLCFLQFSSGTTGNPKAVMVSQFNAMKNVDSIDSSLSENELIGVSWLPLYHDMGLVGSLLYTIIKGGKLILIKPNDFIMKPYLWLKAISDHKATATVAPNFAFGLVCKRMKHKSLEGLDLSSLEYALCGAEMIHQETIDKFYKKFEPIGLKKSAVTPVYGMAESTLAVTFSNFKEEIIWKTFNRDFLSSGTAMESSRGITLCSLGEPLKEMNVDIRDEESSLSLPEGKVGRIFVSGSSVVSGYYKDPVKTNENFHSGVLDTGDRGFLYQGNLYICGRDKDIIISRGRNYYPEKIEERIFQIENIREGKVVASSYWDDINGAEEIVIFAEIKNIKSLDEESLNNIKSLIFSEVSVEGIRAKEVVLVDKGVLPRTSSGKLKRRETVKLWRSGRLINFEDDFKVRLNLVKRYLKIKLDSMNLNLGFNKKRAS